MEIEMELWIGYKSLTSDVMEAKVTDDCVTEGEKGEYILHVMAEQQKFKCTLNKTSLTKLVTEYGKETVNWVSKKVFLCKGSVKDKNALLVYPEKEYQNMLANKKK